MQQHLLLQCWDPPHRYQQGMPLAQMFIILLLALLAVTPGAAAAEPRETKPWLRSRTPAEIAAAEAVAAANKAALQAHIQAGEVEEVWHPPDIKRAHLPHHLEPLIQDNLMQDLALWNNRTYHTAELDGLLAAAAAKDAVKKILIKNGQMYFLNQTNQVTTCSLPCYYRFEDLRQAFLLAAAYNGGKLPFPDVVFVVSMHDDGFCDPVNPAYAKCKAPMLAIMKSLEFNHQDILVPVMEPQVQRPLFNYPWHKKIQKALFRGTAFCQGYTNLLVTHCSRLYLANLTYYYNKSDILDVGMAEGFNEPHTMPNYPGLGPLPPAGAVSIKDHARFKYLLNLEGITTSFRLSKIMHTNSVVLKQNTGYVEWFHRSIHPGVHYLTILNKSADDVFDVMKEYQGRDVKLQEIAAAAQAFAFRYTGFHARIQYWAKALRAYKAMFPDMDGMIKKEYWPEVQRVRAIEEAAADVVQ